MKKIIVICLICFIIFLIIAVIWLIASFVVNKSTNGKLNVNGVDITDKNVTIYRKYANLPLTEVLKNLGCTCEWLDNNTANIIYNNKNYILDLNEIAFLEKGTNNNLITPPPGSTTYHYEVMNHEIVLDDCTIFWILFYMDNKVYIEIDHEQSIVYINKKTE